LNKFHLLLKKTECITEGLEETTGRSG